jgi:hypothetical protein
MSDFIIPDLTSPITRGITGDYVEPEPASIPTSTSIAGGSTKRSHIPHGGAKDTLPLKITAPLSQTRKQAIYNDGSFFLEDVTENSESWQHSILAVGGFNTASFTLKGTTEYLLDFFQNGLMRSVRKENPQGNSIWEGYINRMTLNYGRKIKVKSLDGLFNRILIKFSPATFTTDANGNLVVIADPAQVYFFENSDSINDFGYKEAAINGGERVIQTVIDWGNSIIDDVGKRKWEIQPDINDNPFAGNEMSITVECLGWVHLLKWIHYTITTGGRISKTALVKLVRDTFNTLNTSYFSSDDTFIEENPQLIRKGYNDLPSCWEILLGGNGVANTGGSYFYRWVLGVYENRTIHYNQAKNQQLRTLYSRCSFYEADIKDTTQRIYDGCTGAEVKPWDLRPDNLIITRDETLGGESVNYIEEATFNEPVNYTLVGGNSQRLGVALRQKGLPSFG